MAEGMPAPSEAFVLLDPFLKNPPFLRLQDNSHSEVSVYCVVCACDCCERRKVGPGGRMYVGRGCDAYEILKEKSRKHVCSPFHKENWMEK